MDHQFKQLKIWQLGMEITSLIYDYISDLPTDERFELSKQMNRCSCSIPSNIAEGCSKMTNAHFGEFLSIALGSSYELETQLLICEMRNYGNTELRNRILGYLNEEQKMIYTFRERLLLNK